MNFIYNWTDEDFVYTWDNVQYTIKAGEVVRDLLVSSDGTKRTLIVAGISQHFAKHLANREMIKEKIDLARVDINEKYMQRALTLPEEPQVPKEQELVVSTESEVETEEVATEEKPKRGRPKKVVTE